MCGIFGIMHRDGATVPDEDLLRLSATRLAHRGPDATGFFSDRGVGFAHTRLSLLDPDPRSDQPFWDESGRYGLVYNGEIYNYRILRERLQRRGVRCRTTCDTEVLLLSLIHGEAHEVLRALEGMFAFAFYDRAERSLLLARDRFGMKPLFVYEDEERLLFASELGAMRPWQEPEVDRFTVGSYLLGHGGPMQGATFHRGVRAIPPGGVVTLTVGEAPVEDSFFDLPDFWDEEALAELRRVPSGRIVDRVEEALYTSVEKHMFADVPVGAFCSGGVDSSLIMAMAARMYDDLAIFHANVRGRWSEHDAASALAEHLGLELRSVDVVDRDFVDLIPRVMRHYGHPFTYHPNCAPLMMVARLARDSGVKGLLSGEGSDECYLGYPWLGRKRITDLYYGLVRRAKRLVRAIPELGSILWPDDGGRAGQVAALLNRREIVDEEARTREVADAFGPPGIERENLWSLDYMGHHLRTLLHRNDTMGMAASIEARFPFLDHPLVRVAANLPASYKLRFSPTALQRAHPFVRDKWVVRAVADRYLPRHLSRRRKVGFWTTVFERMRVTPDFFTGSFVQDLFGLSTPQLRRTVEGADQDLTMRLLHLDVWGRTCVEEDESEDRCRARLRRHVTVLDE